MASSSNAQQFSEEMKAAWEIVESEFVKDEILGARVADVIAKHAARASQHELPYAMSVMAACISMANGAGVRVFPNSPSPLMMAVLNVNYPQTRKSAITAAVSRLGRAMDKRASTRARAAYGPKAKAKTSVLAKFTEAAFWERCAPDFQQVSVPAKRQDHPESPDEQSDADDLARTNHGTLLNIDEAYKMLRMLGMIAETGRKKESLDVTDLASDFNRLIQTGIAAYTTKTAGSFGEDSDEKICLGVVGNAHPAIAIPMERGDLGNHHVAIRERWIILTGPVIEPHAPLPGDISLPQGFPRWSWPTLLSTMVAPLGFPEGVDDPEIAAAKLTRAVEVPHSDASGEVNRDETYLPDEEGYYVQLVDGTESRIRFKSVAGKWCPSFRVPNRDVPVPKAESMEKIAERVLDLFEKPGIELGFSEEGLLALRGFQTTFNARSEKRQRP